MKIIFRYTFLSTLLVFSLLEITAQDYCMTSPVGYGENATGGGNNRIVLVETLSGLKTALTASDTSVIIVTNNITFGVGDMIKAVVKNKTLLGMKGVKLISTAQEKNGGILELSNGSNNVIIRNLIFEGPGAYDVDGNDLLQNVGCINLWVDHCEFYDGVDGNFDNTKRADQVTISWCKFGYKLPPKSGGSGGSSDHRFTNLVGGGASDAPSDGHYSITFQYCYWSDGCKERMPRARNAELHILNCYYNTNVSGSLALGLEGGSKGLDCYVEGTHFKNIKSVYKSYDSEDSKPKTLAFSDCIGNNIPSNIGATPQPAYSYPALPVEEVEAAVTSACGAGATLDVTGEGIISSPCSPTALHTVPSKEWQVSQTRNELVVSGIEVAEMSLYNLSGEKILTARASQKMDLTSLNTGFYVLSIQTKEKLIYNRKIII